MRNDDDDDGTHTSKVGGFLIKLAPLKISFLIRQHKKIHFMNVREKEKKKEGMKPTNLNFFFFLFLCILFNMSHVMTFLPFVYFLLFLCDSDSSRSSLFYAE